VQEFLTKSAELYATAPNFFVWMAGIVPAGFALAATGGYWLCSQFRSGTIETQAAQIKLLELQLDITKQSATNANAAVADAKREADILRLAPSNEMNRNRLDAFLSAALSDSRVVVVLLNTALSLAKAIASGKEMEVPALEYKPLVPFNMEKEAKQSVPVYDLGQQRPVGENTP